MEGDYILSGRRGGCMQRMGKRSDIWHLVSWPLAKRDARMLIELIGLTDRASLPVFWLCHYWLIAFPGLYTHRLAVKLSTSLSPGSLCPRQISGHPFPLYYPASISLPHPSLPTSDSHPWPNRKRIIASDVMALPWSNQRTIIHPRGATGFH